MIGATYSSERGVGQWVLAATLAVSLLAGGIALALRGADSAPPDEEDTGVLMVELAPMATSTPMPEQPLPPGPISSDAADSSAVAAQEAAAKPLVEPDQPVS